GGTLGHLGQWTHQPSATMPACWQATPTAQAEVRRNRAMESGAKISTMSTVQIRVYSTGCCSDQASEVAVIGRLLPKRSRTAWVTVETGFHSANTRSGVGKVSSGTKALEMKVIGMITMNEALLITSTLGTSSPT